MYSHSLPVVLLPFGWFKRYPDFKHFLWNSNFYNLQKLRSIKVIDSTTDHFLPILGRFWMPTWKERLGSEATKFFRHWFSSSSLKKDLHPGAFSAPETDDFRRGKGLSCKVERWALPNPAQPAPGAWRWLRGVWHLRGEANRSMVGVLAFHLTSHAIPFLAVQLLGDGNFGWHQSNKPHALAVAPDWQHDFFWKPRLPVVFGWSLDRHHDCLLWTLAYRTHFWSPVPLELSQVLVHLSESSKTIV